MLRPLFAIALTATLLIAGCISPPDSAEAARLEDAGFGATLPASSQGEMTMGAPEESTSRDVCLLEGISLPDAEPYCARRTVRAGGVLTLDALPVKVRGGAAKVQVELGEAGVWSAELVVTGRGASPEEAEAAARAVEVVVEIGAPGAHALLVQVRVPDGASARGSEVVLRLPEATLYEMRADGGSGAMQLSGLRTTLTDVDSGSGGVSIAKWRADTLLVDAGSGRVELDVDASHLRADLGSGGLSGTIRPVASGAIEIDGGSGDVSLALPEGPRQGYDLLVETGSGSKDVQLKDGTTRAEGREDVRFTTNGFSARAVRTTGEISLGSGSVTLRSA